MTRASAEGWTPGPWQIARSLQGYPYQICAPNGVHIKSVTRWAGISVPSLPEGEANARLIAAAPDLYEALKAFSTAYECEDDSYADKLNAANDLMVAALARATGEQP